MQREIDPAYMEFVMDALHMQTDKVLIAKKGRVMHSCFSPIVSVFKINIKFIFSWIWK